MKHWSYYKFFIKGNIITFEFGRKETLFEFINQQQDVQFAVSKEKNDKKRIAYFYSTPITEKYEEYFEE